MLTQQSVPLPSPNLMAPGAALKYIDTNLLVQKALQHLEAAERKNIIFRCDELPYVHGTEEKLLEFFVALFRLISSKKNTVPQLFLHINFQVESDNTVLTLNDEERIFSIRFNTNITPCTEWMNDKNEHLDKLAAIATSYGGNFQLHQSGTSGCVLAVSLQGKRM